MAIPRRICFFLTAASICLAAQHCTWGAPPKQKRPAAKSLPPAGKQWMLTFRYGGGTPSDSEPLGHCRTTISADGHLTIKSNRRSARVNNNVQEENVVYESDFSPEMTQLLIKCADAALHEAPFRRRGANEDGNFLVLDRSGPAAARVNHNQLDDFLDAPPNMIRFVKLFNDLVPRRERIDLKRDYPAKEVHIEPQAVSSSTAPEWSVELHIEAANAEHEPKRSYLGRFHSAGAGALKSNEQVLYEHDALISEDLSLLHAAAKAACQQESRNVDDKRGLSFRVEIHDREGQVVAEHRENGLRSFSEASPDAKRVIRWLNDHLPMPDRIDTAALSPPGSEAGKTVEHLSPKTLQAK